MVAPTRELVNTLFSSSITAFQTSQIAHIPSTMDMDVDSDIVRGRSASSSRNSSRKSSILSKASSITYHECMEVINTLMSKKIWEPVNMSQLSYMSINRDVEEGKLVSEATDNSLQGKTSHVTNEAPALNNTPKP